MKEYELLKKYRELRGLTQKEVAEKLSMTHSGYSKYERGERKISVDVLFDIMSILKIPTSAFGSDDEFLETDYWITYEQQLYEIAQEYKKNKDKLTSKQIESTAELFVDTFNRIELDKKKMRELLKPIKFESIIKEYDIEELFKN